MKPAPVDFSFFHCSQRAQEKDGVKLKPVNGVKKAARFFFFEQIARMVGGIFAQDGSFLFCSECCTGFWFQQRFVEHTAQANADAI